MPKWTHDPPAPGDRPALPILRTPAQSTLVAAITSPDLIGTHTHFWGGHTVPCDAPDCDACNHGIPSRWHGYVSAFELKTGLHFIFEFTAAAADHLLLYRAAHGTLRGCIFQATRWHRRNNGRVMLKTATADLERTHLPQPPDLAACMAIIWSLAETPQSTATQAD